MSEAAFLLQQGHLWWPCSTASVVLSDTSLQLHCTGNKQKMSESPFSGICVFVRCMKVDPVVFDMRVRGATHSYCWPLSPATGSLRLKPDMNPFCSGFIVLYHPYIYYIEYSLVSLNL